MNFGYIIAAAISVLAIVAAYLLEFVGRPGLAIVPDTSVWGNFGSYFGGIAGPVLNFISLFFLIRSLKLQNEANEALRNELRNSERSEKLKSFSDLFFSLINAQRPLLEKLKLKFTANGLSQEMYGVEAILELEDNIKILREQKSSKEEIENYIDSIDEYDQIFGIVRAFYLSVKMVNEKLGNSQGFSEIERKDFLNALINFTDFPQIRLILLSIQFLDTKAASYLHSDKEFIGVLTDVGLKIDPY